MRGEQHRPPTGKPLRPPVRLLVPGFVELGERLRLPALVRNLHQRAPRGRAEHDRPVRSPARTAGAVDVAELDRRAAADGYLAQLFRRDESDPLPVRREEGLVGTALTGSFGQQGSLPLVEGPKPHLVPAAREHDVSQPVLRRGAHRARPVAAEEIQIGREHHAQSRGRFRRRRFRSQHDERDEERHGHERRGGPGREAFPRRPRFRDGDRRRLQRFVLG